MTNAAKSRTSLSPRQLEGKVTARRPVIWPRRALLVRAIASAAFAEHTLRERGEAWQQTNQPVIQNPHSFLPDKIEQSGPTGTERDAVRRWVEREIHALEREWNAVYSEESWVAWKGAMTRGNRSNLSP